VSTTLKNLLRETLEADCDEFWENKRVPTPIRVFGVRLHSMGLSVREVVAGLSYLTLSGLMEPSGTGRMISLKHKPTRRWRSRHESPLMKKIRPMATRNGCTQRLIQSRSYYWRLTYITTARPVPRRRFSTAWRRNTMFQRQSFWLMLVATWLPSFDTI